MPRNGEGEYAAIPQVYLVECIVLEGAGRDTPGGLSSQVPASRANSATETVTPPASSGSNRQRPDSSWGRRAMQQEEPGRRRPARALRSPAQARPVRAVRVE